jgi:hypothetical protein
MKSHFLKQRISTSLLMIISVFTIFIAVSSCIKDKEELKENNKEEPVINDNYYVKYVISCSYPHIFSNWSVSTPDGTYTRNNYQTRRWEQTYGPVKKGFNCSASVGNGNPSIAIEIYVSKNQEPFALKTTSKGNYAHYTINF